MKTAPRPIGAPMESDPKIVKKTRRDSAAHGSFSGLRDEESCDYMHQPDRGPAAPRLLEFGRPGL
jgi:hypothetical protein